MTRACPSLSASTVVGCGAVRWRALVLTSPNLAQKIIHHCNTKYIEYKIHLVDHFFLCNTFSAIWNLSLWTYWGRHDFFSEIFWQCLALARLVYGVCDVKAYMWTCTVVILSTGIMIAPAVYGGSCEGVSNDMCVSQINHFNKAEDRAVFITDRHLYKMDPLKQYKPMKSIPLYNVSILLRREETEVNMKYNLSLCRVVPHGWTFYHYISFFFLRLI